MACSRGPGQFYNVVKKNIRACFVVPNVLSGLGEDVWTDNCRNRKVFVRVDSIQVSSSMANIEGLCAV